MKARLQDERGLTMVEMMVTMVVGLVIMFAIFGLVDTSTQLSAKTDDRVETTGRARIAMDLITRQIRSQVCQGTGLPALTEGRGDMMEFYASLAPEQTASGSTPPLAIQRRRLTFRPGASGQPGDILEEVWTGTGQRPTVTFPPLESPTTRRVLVTGVTPTGTTPVFRYYRFAVDPALGYAVPTPITTTPLSDSDRARTVQVDVNYTAVGRKTGSNVPLEGTVYVRTSNPTNPNNSPLCL